MSPARAVHGASTVAQAKVFQEKVQLFSKNGTRDRATRPDGAERRANERESIVRAALRRENDGARSTSYLLGTSL